MASSPPASPPPAVDPEAHRSPEAGSTAGDEVRLASFPADLEIARSLFREYRDTIHADVCFEAFDRELEELDRRYAPPAGLLLLAFEGGVPAGCAALRAIAAGRAEACRLFVRSSARGAGLGGALVLRLLEEARAGGFRSVVLETLPQKMGAAVGLYRALGFREIPPYAERPVPGALYMELALG